MDAERLLVTSEVAMEYAALRNDEHCPQGVYVVPAPPGSSAGGEVLVWDGVLFVHQGPYASAVLTFRIRFPLQYPSREPIVHFLADTFHPLISPDDGLLNISSRFSPWRPKQDHVFHLLHWMKAMFKKNVLDALREEDALNKEALRLYREQPQSFAALAAQTAMLSQTSPAVFGSSSTHPTHARTPSSIGSNPLLSPKPTSNRYSHARTLSKSLTGSPSPKPLQQQGEEMDAMRSRLGLRNWTVASTPERSEVQVSNNS